MDTCKNCKWCAVNDLKDMICVNSESEYTSDYVDETHVCDEHEPKRKRRQKNKPCQPMMQGEW